MKKIMLLLMLSIASLTPYAQDYVRFKSAKEKYGYKDAKGNITIYARYDFLSSQFSEGYTWGTLHDKKGFVSKDGKEITPFKYDDVTHFSNGFARVNVGAVPDEEMGEYVGGKWGFINAQGKEITPLKYDDLYSFTKEGFAIVYVGNKTTVINTSGRELAPPKYDYLRFSTTEPDIAVVNIGGKYDEVFGELSFNQFVGGKQGFLNCSTGKEITPVQFSNIGDFSEGLAPVNMGAVHNGVGYAGGKWGFIDKTGKIIIPIKYENAGYFSQGKAEVTLNGKTFSIDKTGKEIK